MKSSPQVLGMWPAIVGVASMVLASSVACAQNYPNKPVRIFTTEPGSANDIATRLIAPGVSANLGQQLVVDNRTGLIAVESAAKAAPDGYTLLHFGSTVWLLPFMRDNVPWDPIKDFSAVTLSTSSPNLLVVHPSLPARSVAELIALAKARPGELNVATATAGGAVQLAAEQFKALAGVNIVRIPYKGAGPALNALIAGELQMMFPTAGAAAPHLKSGRLKALAVTSARPSALAPGLPTVAASGLPGYESASMLVILAPARTPEAIIGRLNQEIVRMLNAPEVKEKLFTMGVEVIGSSPEELASWLKADMARMGKVIREAGIRAE